MDCCKVILQRWERVLADHCSSWIKDESGESFLIDPVDKQEISAHYGTTHTAAALLLMGQISNDDVLFGLGKKLLISILNRWDYVVTLPAFHFDFNNFALCIIEETLPEGDSLAERIRTAILKTPDSSHDTINWLPMRAFVNKQRYKWTSRQEYLATMNSCLSIIAKATNKDGGIEDRLPKGTSYNLQYDIATVCCLQYLRLSGVEIDLSRELGFLLNAVAPDGDINYQGRGTNQIFAWSCWIYLLASSGRVEDLNLALSYLEGKLQKMLIKNNILLNDDPGYDKRMWWDYHYASVYISHLFFWLVLAERDFGKLPIVPKCICDGSTGLNIYKGENYFVAVFDGRKEYLAEQGPIVTAVWTKSEGMIFKGSFGPWQGLFGNNHCPEESVLSNYWGAISIKQNKDWHQNRYVRKLLPRYFSPSTLSLQPVFSTIKVIEDNSEFLDIQFSIPSKCCLNLPVFLSSNYTPRVFADEQSFAIMKKCMIQNQYDVLKVYRTELINRVKLIVRISK